MLYDFAKATKAAKEQTLPNPKGYKVLIAIPEVSEKTSGGIYRPDVMRSQEETATIIGQIISMGDMCYRDEEKFPTGPWCEIGDWVVFRPYSGTRMKIAGQEYRLINDDTIEAVVEDISSLERT